MTIKSYQMSAKDKKMLEKLYPKDPVAQKAVEDILNQPISAKQKREKLIDILLEETESENESTESDFEDPANKNTIIEIEYSATSDESLADELELNLSYENRPTLNIAMQDNFDIMAESFRPQASSSDEEQDFEPVDFDKMKDPGEIERRFPRDIKTQRKVRYLLNHPMPAKVRNQKLQEFINAEKKPKTDQECANELFNYYMSQKSKFVASDNDSDV